MPALLALGFLMWILCSSKLLPYPKYRNVSSALDMFKNRIKRCNMWDDRNGIFPFIYIRHFSDSLDINHFCDCLFDISNHSISCWQFLYYFLVSWRIQETEIVFSLFRSSLNWCISTKIMCWFINFLPFFIVEYEKCVVMKRAKSFPNFRTIPFCRSVVYIVFYNMEVERFSNFFPIPINAIPQIFHPFNLYDGPYNDSQFWSLIKNIVELR